MSVAGMTNTTTITSNGNQIQTALTQKVWKKQNKTDHLLVTKYQNDLWEE